MSLKIKTCELKKYGEKCKAVVAVERIYPNEKLVYYAEQTIDCYFTKQQLLDIIKDNPELEYFIKAQSYLVDDDIYRLPSDFRNENCNSILADANHSCEPNIISTTSDYNTYFALRVIEPGEEIVVNYSRLDNEQSMGYGMKCLCDSKNCDGILKYDKYRDEEFVKKYNDYLSPFLKKKVEDMKERWYSGSCYVKRVPTTKTSNIREWKTCLCSFKDIKKDDLIAKFSSDVQINESMHFIRHSNQPNCYLKDRNVFASVDIPQETELTLCFY